MDSDADLDRRQDQGEKRKSFIKTNAAYKKTNQGS